MGKISRRLVMTGHDAAGVSRVMSDRRVTGTPGPAVPGSEIAQGWGSDGPVQYPDQGGFPAYAGFFPLPHGARLTELYLPAKAVTYDAGMHDDPVRAGGMRMGAKPGMHRTATTDIIIMMEGRVDCELDEGEVVTLGPGDILIQNGTMHAWSNPYDEPCRYLAVMFGAGNELCE